jgi:Ca-activated chloride channel homolog
MLGRKANSAKEATANFIRRLEPDDEIYAYTFDDVVAAIKPFGRAETVQEELAQNVRGITASGGTALNDAICIAVGQANELRATDTANGERRLYGVVVLSDGEDTASSKTRAEMLECLPTGEDVEGVKAFTIAYGSDAEQELLQDIADRSNGKAYLADPDTIEQVYNEISGQQ